MKTSFSCTFYCSNLTRSQFSADLANNLAEFILNGSFAECGKGDRSKFCLFKTHDFIEGKQSAHKRTMEKGPAHTPYVHVHVLVHVVNGYIDPRQTCACTPRRQLGKSTNRDKEGGENTSRQHILTSKFSID